jgi:hypothetical protein
MADPKALAKLAGIEQKLADLTDLGKKMQGSDDPAELAALQARFRELARSFDEQVRTIQAALTEAGLVKRPKYSLALDAAQTALVKERTGVDMSTVELDEPPARALTPDELLEVALRQARARVEAAR